MFFPLIISTLTAAPISIVDITTTQHASGISVNVGADALMNVDQARGKLEKDAIRIFLNGVTMEEAEKYFPAGHHNVRARVQGDKVELKIPLARGANCAGPVHFDTSASGLTANVSCHDPKAAKEEEVANVAAPTIATPSVPTVAAIAMPSEPKANEPKAMQAVANAVANSVSQAFAPTTLATKSAAQQSAAKSATPPVIATATTVVATTTTPAAESATKVEAMAPQALRAAPAEVGSKINFNILMPIAVLLGLAAFAFYAQKRRPLRTRTIQILETAHLGPKRSLIVAKIGNETLLLGTSEAGITLLSSRPISLPNEVGNHAGINELSLAEDADPNFTKQENAFFSAQQKSGGLSNLFARFKKPRITDETKTGNSFEDFLVDSAEDDELRRKLSQGITGRIS